MLRLTSPVTGAGRNMGGTTLHELSISAALDWESGKRGGRGAIAANEVHDGQEDDFITEPTEVER